LGMTEQAFIAAHNAKPLRVLAMGFAPGFVYCGFHPEPMQVPRRASIRPKLPPGTVLFAAGQTAITATAIPSGWSVIGRTAFLNFDAGKNPPTKLVPGDTVLFEEAGT
jgi:allophanate hydrolase subunit 1